MKDNKCNSYQWQRWLVATSLLVAAAAVAPVQTAAQLGIQTYAGLSITGPVGTVYAVQAIPDVAQTNGWSCLALVQLPATTYIWVDTSKSAATGQRFYRAVVSATNLVFLQRGTFTMGSPTNEALREEFGFDETQHIVTISQGFWMSRYLVTQGDYLAVVGSNPSYFNTNSALPVEQVTWNAATNYCALRTQLERAAGLIPTNYVYRLPTESEWEYACRSGTTTAFYLGSGLHSGQANFNGQQEYDAAVGTISNPSGIYLQTPTPVGTYAANGWGLYDMIGNVAEWCQDWYGAYPTGSVTDPQGPVTGSYRLIRGGWWAAEGEYCRSARRVADVPTYSKNNLGFRVVLAPTGP
jgi:formylglycine-generating enzyme required for sulfatase activity